jgi:hypothetical protein
MADRQSVTVTTAADGSATAYLPTEGFISGPIATMRYVKTDFADGSSFTITSEATGETIWSESSVNASATRAPRQATHSTAGVASLYAAAGTAVQDKVVLFRDRIKIVIASGGNVKTGVFHAVVG